MPSEDTFHAENPQTNRWLDESATSSPSSATSRGSSRASTSATGGSRTEHVSASLLQRLAASLGISEDDLQKRVPADTIRRLKFPVLEQTDPETGLSRFEHDRGVVRDHRTPLLAPDRAHEAIPKGTNGRGAGTSQGRSDVTGRFTK